MSEIRHLRDNTRISYYISVTNFRYQSEATWSMVYGCLVTSIESLKGDSTF